MKFKASLLILILLSLALILSACSGPAPEEPSYEPAETEAPAESDSDMSQDTPSEEMTDDVEGQDEGMVSEEDLPEMTLDELSTYTGKDGQPAYVAVDGIVYDVSHLDKWKTGQHMGQHDAGQDLSEEILESPHGKKILERAIPVAKLVE